MYNIAICDDEIKTLESLTKIIKEKFIKLGIYGNYFVTSNSVELLDVLHNERIDVLFLDIDMPNINGMDIGEYLLNKGETNIFLIFVTSHDALVYKSFKYHPFGFIRKSYLNEEIDDVIKSVSKKIQEKNDKLVIKVNKEVMNININNIVYFEGEGNYVNLYTKKERVKFRGTLSNLEKELINKGFLRIHKGYLISQKYVFLLNSKEVKLNNGALIPIGRSYLESTKKELMKYMR